MLILQKRSPSAARQAWHDRGRPARRALAAGVLVAVVAAALLLAGTGAGVRGIGVRGVGSRAVARLGRGSEQATVTVGAHAGASRIPPSFLGLSFESWGLQEFERHSSLLARTLSLLRAPGDGPLLVRIGGNSSDRSFWDPSGHGLPPWAFAFTPAYLQHTAALVRAADARLLIDLNLATARPQVSARLAAASARLLPAGSIAGFEVGNEPDLYAHTAWVAAFSRQTHDPAAATMSARTYALQFATYAALLAHIAPEVPLVGPALGYPDRDLSWLATLLSDAAPRLGFVSAHLYPYTACAKPSSRLYPTIARLLSEAASAGLARSIAPAVRLASRAQLGLRVTELNSVSCGGRSGVSDAVASALWAPDAMFELLRAGVAGVNIHIRAEAVNGAFALSSRGLVARPLLYGMILFTRTVAAGSQLLQSRELAPASLHLKAWVVALSDGDLHVLLIDKGSRPAHVHLRLPAVGVATVQRLSAPGVAARSGVTLDGQRLDASGRWRGRAASETVPAGPEGYNLMVPAGSAALLSVRAQPPG